MTDTKCDEIKPYKKLTPENMTKDDIGLGVTLWLNSFELQTQSGIIESYDENNIHIRIGTKLKKLKYDPDNIILKVYQFEKGFRFVPEFEYDNLKDDIEQNEKSSSERVTPPKSKKKTKTKIVEW